MDPYIFAILMIILIGIVGALTVKRVYDRRTREPKLNIEMLGLELPDGISLSDALGDIFRR